MTNNQNDLNFHNWQLPNYLTSEIAQKKSKYCVCIFVINEGEKIQKQLQKMQDISQNIDIIIADGGSTDDSLNLDFLKNVHIRTLLTKQDRGKLSTQMRMAFAYALMEGYEGIITIDGNNKDDPSAIPMFVEALEQGYDHIQGSRFIPGGKAINTPWARYWAVRLIHAPLISLASGFKYTDTTNGFRGYSRQFLLDEKVAPFRDVFSAYELHYYLAIRSVKLGYKVKELPVTRAYPNQGPTPTKISPIKGNLIVLLTLFKACLHQFNLKK
ncbi:glycosyltransferase family 2 protein [Geminocystis sp. GBBB08]|uniref:glycosyltransferase family 2 protein n=1 Tax=Geminocystis sp. GBBB08 TaxID=2604140 RepID=UPI0027E28802|nr:glycosyltransferase family 2 protein [Geminocystis sp. GBBB08]MBL1209093.1 glycosyltransferase family 2 protein [Geminocystis sp. GBBB08]